MPEPYTPDGSKVTYTVPSLDDPADGPQAFRDFADSIPPGLSAAIPIRVKDADYTLALDDEGAGVFFDTTTESHRVTVPAHSSVAFPVGTAIVIGNVGTNKEGNVQIAPADGVTVRDTAVRKVGLNRMAVLLQVEQDSWIINAGTGGGPAPGSVPSPPKLVAAIGGPECAYLSWEAPKDDGGHDITTYVVERSTDNSTWVIAAQTSGKELSAVAINLEVGKEVFFRVKAANILGQSDPSNVLSAVPKNDYNDATGGTVRTFSLNGKTYRSHTFLSGTDTFTVNKAAVPFNVLIVAGGGGGSNADAYCGWGGGGAGGVITGLLPLAVGNMNVKVGAGGGAATNGQDTIFGTYTAVGGGAGGKNAGNAGGSGGGAGQNGGGGKGVTGQGFDGGSGGDGNYKSGAGGGGASQAGQSFNGSKGGDGVAFSLMDGTERWYGGGGGGGGSQGAQGGEGGRGGGGKGGAAPGMYGPQSGQPNTGGGGGGCGGSNGGGGPGPGGSGGSGIVVVAYEVAPFNDAEGGVTSTYTKNGSTFKVHTFTNAGNLIVKQSNRPFRVLVVGGGGGTGSNWGCDTCCGDAGGSGAGYNYVSDSDALPLGEYTISVGNGGSAAGARQVGGAGGTSSLVGQGVSRTANGGEGGGQSGSGCCQDRGCRVDGKGGSQFENDISGTSKPYAGSGGPGSNVGPDPGKNGVAGTVIVSYQIG